MRSLFEDKRCTAGVVGVWMLAMIVLFAVIGVFHSNFFHVGPSPSLHFMSVNIDTWSEWGMLASFCFIDSVIKAFGHDSIVIWSYNTLCDPTKSATYPKWVCLAIVQTYYVYIYFSGIFGLFIGLSQIDFVVINHISDLTTKFYTYNSYIDQKAKHHHDDVIAVVVGSEEKV